MTDHIHHTDSGGPGMAAAVAMTQHSGRADQFLDEHTRLARMQREQMEEENATRRRLLRLEHASALFKLALEVAVAIVVILIAAGLSAAVWSAASDNGLIVESFSVPPDLAGRGVTGDVVAQKLLDRLSALQDQTQSNRASSSYANNWGSDIKLQIPDTGVSIGEFNRSLHAWLGHQTRITGEIYRTPLGLSITARAGNAAGPTYTGSDAELDELMQKAAESVYRATQPYRYAVYLANVGRTKEAEALYQQLIASGSEIDRAWALIGLENIYNNRGDYAHSRGALDRALAIKPDFVMSYINRAGLEGQFQHDEAGLSYQRKVVDMLHGRRDPDMGELAWTLAGLQAESSLAGDLGDYAGQIEVNRRIEALPDFNGSVDQAHQTDITSYALLHDVAAANRAFDALPAATSDLARLQHDGTRALSELLLGRYAFILDNEKRFDAILSKIGPVGRVVASRQFWPFAAYGYALKGDFRSAHALVDRTPADCNQCLRVRALIDAREKNWAGMDYWFARASADAPSTPQPWSDWGRTLLEKGDADRAIEKLKVANALAPRFADPLEHWGEALMLKHRSDLALDKFQEAARLAPNWKRLHQKWGEALAFVGRRDEAERHFAIARSLDG